MPNDVLKEEIYRRFRLPDQSISQHRASIEIMDRARNFAFVIHEKCPPNRELSIALTHLETAVAFAIKSLMAE